MPFASLSKEYARRRAAEPVSGPIHTREKQLCGILLHPRTVTGLWVAGFLLLWTYTAASYLPSPIEVLRALPGLWNDDGLGVQLWSSLGLNLQAVFLTSGVCLAIAYATAAPGIIGRVMRPFAILTSSGRYNGMVGLPLVFMSLLHNPHWVKVALLLFGTGVFMLLSLVHMIDAIPGELYDHSRTLRMGEWRVMWEVVILGRFDEVLDIIRIGAAMIWMMLPMVEGYFRFEGGVGVLMLTESKHLNLDSVFAIMFVVLCIGAGQDWVIGQLRKAVCPYADLEVKK